MAFTKEKPKKIRGREVMAKLNLLFPKSIFHIFLASIFKVLLGVSLVIRSYTFTRPPLTIQG